MATGIRNKGNCKIYSILPFFISWDFSQDVLTTLFVTVDLKLAHFLLLDIFGMVANDMDLLYLLFLTPKGKIKSTPTIGCSRIELRRYFENLEMTIEKNIEKTDSQEV